MSDWTDRQDAMLEGLYAKVPDAGCKGLCQEHCTSIVGGKREAQRMTEAGFPIPTSHLATQREAGATLRLKHGLPCAALDDDGRCQAYRVRPLICRLWGAAEGLPCEHGCVPEGGRLSDAEAALLIKRSKSI